MRSTLIWNPKMPEIGFPEAPLPRLVRLPGKDLGYELRASQVAILLLKNKLPGYS